MASELDERIMNDEAYKFLKYWNYDKNDSFRKHMLLGLYISCMGAYAVPFMGIQMTSIAMQRTVLEGFGLVFSEGTYFLTNLVIFMVFLALYAVMMKTVFKCNLVFLFFVNFITKHNARKNCNL